MIGHIKDDRAKLKTGALGAKLPEFVPKFCFASILLSRAKGMESLAGPDAQTAL